MSRSTYNIVVAYNTLERNNIMKNKLNKYEKSQLKILAKKWLWGAFLILLIGLSCYMLLFAIMILIWKRRYLLWKQKRFTAWDRFCNHYCCNRSVIIVFAQNQGCTANYNYWTWWFMAGYCESRRICWWWSYWISEWSI